MSRFRAKLSPPVFEPALERAARRAGGVYYTPPEIARQIAELTLAPLQARGPLCILDPACGAGEFLVAARDALAPRRDRSATLFGIDIDPEAVVQTRSRLGCDGKESEHILHADALAPGLALPPGSFDAVIGNPPYVSIRELARSQPAAYIRQLRERFATARGNFDLYVLFIERALHWLREGGRCGLIVPNKWATLDYARPCREMLLEETSLEEVIDLSSHHTFRRASVYPHVLIFTKGPPARNAALRVSGERVILQSSLSPAAIVLEPSLQVESQVETRPLGDLARLSCGTPGYAAARTAAALREQDEAEPDDPQFITSGNIDRYAIHPGSVRYQCRDWRFPRLSIIEARLSPARRNLFTSPKIVISGMSRRIEAAWDSRGLALGVQVFTVSELEVDPFYLLALLNSKLLSYLFRTRFASKRLGGGYLAINKGQLAQLPIPVPAGHQRSGLQRIECLSALAADLSKGNSRQPEADDAKIDRLVGQLYRLDAQQIAEVEAHFAELDRRHRAAA